MTEEPYRWMEAIGNRREYVENQLAGGSPIVGLTWRGGVLLFTVSRQRQKLFEIYDRIALGGIGHPGDLERLRMTAIELAGTEGFTRSADDVSLRRLATYSLSPALKAAFEQIYGPPYLARLLFAELGRAGAPNLFLRLDYDGDVRTNGGAFGRAFEDFGVISGAAPATDAMERYLSTRAKAGATLHQALEIAADAWAVGHLAAASPDAAEAPGVEAIAEVRRTHFAAAVPESVVMEQEAASRITYRQIGEAEIRTLLDAR